MRLSALVLPGSGHGPLFVRDDQDEHGGREAAPLRRWLRSRATPHAHCLGRYQEYPGPAVVPVAAGRPLGPLVATATPTPIPAAAATATPASRPIRLRVMRLLISFDPATMCARAACGGADRARRMPVTTSPNDAPSVPLGGWGHLAQHGGTIGHPGGGTDGADADVGSAQLTGGKEVVVSGPG